MRSKIAQEIIDEMEPKHRDLVREYGALWLENDQQAIQIKALKEQLQAAAATTSPGVGGGGGSVLEKRSKGWRDGYRGYYFV